MAILPSALASTTPMSYLTSGDIQTHPYLSLHTHPLIPSTMPSFVLSFIFSVIPATVSDRHITVELVHKSLTVTLICDVITIISRAETTTTQSLVHSHCCSGHIQASSPSEGTSSSVLLSLAQKLMRSCSKTNQTINHHEKFHHPPTKSNMAPFKPCPPIIILKALLRSLC